MKSNEIRRIANEIISSKYNNLGTSNSYYSVIKPFNIFIIDGSSSSNMSYGKTKLYKPVYKEKTVKPGDEIHNLHGGTFYIEKGSNHGVNVVMEKEDEFSKKIQKFPLEKLNKINQSEKSEVRY